MHPQVPNRPIISYFRDGQYVSIAPEMLEWLGGDVEVLRRLGVDDYRHGYDVIESKEPAFAGERVPNAGLLDLLAYRAHQHGYRLIENAITPISSLPEPANQSQLSYSKWSEFVHREERGLARISNSVDVAILIADLLVAFPDKRIILLGQVNDIRPIYLRLLTLLSADLRRQKTLALVHGARPLRQADDEEFPRLICCTPTAAADLDSEKCDIVVMYDAFECLHERMQWPLIQMDAGFRLFGIVRVDRMPKSYEHARILQVFGFAQIDLMNNGRVRRPVHYAWVRHAGQSPPGTVISNPGVGSRKATESVNPNAAYVHNHHRNDLICRLARKLQLGEAVDSSRFDEIRRWLRGRELQRLSITIVVDRLDHAIMLGHRLTHWPIFADPNSNLHNLSKGVRERINARSFQWLPHQIVVSDVAWSAPGHHSDVIIWAGGGAATDVPSSWMYSSNYPDRPLLIVDFLDDFTAVTRSWSFQRRDGLVRNDVFRVGTPAVIGRIQEFEKLIGGRR